MAIDRSGRELASYTRMQKAIFDGVQEAMDDTREPAHVPYGRCRRHPQVTISNGMFDGLCYLCENDDDMSAGIDEKVIAEINQQTQDDERNG